MVKVTRLEHQRKSHAIRGQVQTGLVAIRVPTPNQVPTGELAISTSMGLTTPS